jgi:hypothetical protein
MEKKFFFSNEQQVLLLLVLCMSERPLNNIPNGGREAHFKPLFISPQSIAL